MNDIIEAIGNLLAVIHRAMTDFQQAADLLTRLNRWRKGGRGEMPDPSEITAAIDIAVQALKIAQAAKEWRDAEQAKEVAKRRFSLAVMACTDYHRSDEGNTVWLLHRISGPDFHGAGSGRWVYPDGSDASNDPRAIENQAAYRALKEARKVAGIKRATLTRMIGRLTK
jgi:hypothetical protein